MLRLQIVIVAFILSRVGRKMLDSQKVILRFSKVRTSI